jgi:hypothetical protein
LDLEAKVADLVGILVMGYGIGLALEEGSEAVPKGVVFRQRSPFVELLPDRPQGRELERRDPSHPGRDLSPPLLFVLPTLGGGRRSKVPEGSRVGIWKERAAIRWHRSGAWGLGGSVKDGF